MKQRLQAWGDTTIIHIACCYIFNDSGEVLMLQRHSEDLGGGQWALPGGRINKNESPKQAVVREIREETRLDVKDVTELGVHEVTMPHGTVNMTTFKAHVPSSAIIRTDPEEHHAHAWFDAEGILDEKNILWGIPTVMRDFGLITRTFGADPTLADGSTATLIRVIK